MTAPFVSESHFGTNMSCCATATSQSVDMARDNSSNWKRVGPPLFWQVLSRRPERNHQVSLRLSWGGVNVYLEKVANSHVRTLTTLLWWFQDALWSNQTDICLLTGFTKPYHTGNHQSLALMVRPPFTKRWFSHCKPEWSWTGIPQLQIPSTSTSTYSHWDLWMFIPLLDAMTFSVQ